MNIKDVRYWDRQFKRSEEDDFVNIHGTGSYEELKPLTGKVLDVACGDMDYLDSVKRAGDNYLVGLDFSKKALKMAKKKTRGKGVALVRAAAQYMPFRDNAFDNVLCVELLHREAEYEKILREIHRTSNSNAFLTLHHKDEAIKTNLKLEGNIAKEDGMIYTYFDEDEVLKMLETIGFGSASIRVFRFEDIWEIPPTEPWPYYFPPRETKAVMQVECKKL